MRHGEAFDLQIAKHEARTGLKNLPVGPVAEPALHGAARGLVGEDADVRVFFQPVDAGGMVAVLVREEDGVDPFQRFAERGEEHPEFPRGESRVDKHARALRHEQRRVARAAAAENAEAHRHLGGVG